MNVRLKNFFGLTAAGLLLLSPCSVFGEPARGSHYFKEPFLVIYQIGADLTMTDPKMNFPFGLVAAVWDDGWVVRAKSKKLVGKQYIEGYGTSKGLQKLITEVTSPTILATPDKTSMGVDDPFRVINVYNGTQKHQWIRDLPDLKGMSFEIEARAWDLPLQEANPAPSKDWSLKQYTGDD